MPRQAGDNVGLRLFLAVYHKNVPLDTLADRRKHLEGFVVGILGVKGIVEGGLSSLTPAGIDVRLVDSTDSRREQELYFHRSRLDPSATRDWDAAKRQSDLRAAQTRDVAGRRWSVACVPVPQYIATSDDLVSVGRRGGRPAADRPSRGVSGRDRHDGMTERSRLAAQLTETNRRLKREIADRQQAEVDSAGKRAAPPALRRECQRRDLDHGPFRPIHLRQPFGASRCWDTRRKRSCRLTIDDILTPASLGRGQQET